jgi:hypothetical protein
MLRGWPEEQLYWWSNRAESESCFRHEVAAHYIAPFPPKLYPHSKFARLKSKLLRRLWVPRAALDLNKQLQKVRPDAVWAIAHEWSIIPARMALPNSGVGFHVTVQDYPDNHRNRARFGVSICRQMMSDSEFLYSTAATRDATSHPMIDDLRRRTGKEAAQMLHAGLENDDFRGLEKMHESVQNKIRIGYAGTIVAEDVFTLFVSALKKLRQQGYPLEIAFFGAHSYRTRAWYETEWMVEYGDLPEEDLQRRLQECTWGFAPMAVTDDDSNYNHFSFPTKFVTYLRAGLPIITLGHQESSVVKMARSYNVGVCSNATTIDHLLESLAPVLQLNNTRAAYVEEILRCARAEFDAEKTRGVLRRCLEECARTTRRLANAPAAS